MFQNIGMSESEIQRYSIVKYIRSRCSGVLPSENAGLEQECSKAVTSKFHLREPMGAYIPNDVLSSPMYSRDLPLPKQVADYTNWSLDKRPVMQARALEKGGTGGFLVATDLLASSFIDILYNRMAVKKMGATILSGLVGDCSVPKATSGSTGYWVSEDGPIIDGSSNVFTSVGLTPHTAAGWVSFSRKLLIQSTPDIEGLVRADLARTVALLLDSAAINGLGSSNQPLGLMNAGIPVVYAGSGSGGTGGAPSYSTVCSMEAVVSAANADLSGNLGYMTNSLVRNKLRQIQRFTNTDSPVWLNESINGIPGTVSNQIPSNLILNAGTGLSAILYGSWDNLIIAEWNSPLDLLIDPYTGSSTGSVLVRICKDCDVGIRHIESFCLCKDVVTT